MPITSISDVVYMSVILLGWTISILVSWVVMMIEVPFVLARVTVMTTMEIVILVILLHRLSAC